MTLIKLIPDAVVGEDINDAGDPRINLGIPGKTITNNSSTAAEMSFEIPRGMQATVYSGWIYLDQPPSSTSHGFPIFSQPNGGLSIFIDEFKKLNVRYATPNPNPISVDNDSSGRV